MYIGLLAFIGGVLAKVFLIVVQDFKKKDLKPVISALLFSLFIAFTVIVDSESPQMGIILGLYFFIPMVSFGLKDKILPRITEGALLLYGIISLYLFETYFKATISTGVIIEGILIFYCLVMLVLCIARVRIRTFIQVLLFVCFLLFNLVIILTFIQFGNFDVLLCFTCALSDFNNWSVFLTGFITVDLVSNILFILYFIPVPMEKGESYRQRILNIKQHAKDLEEKYIDIDIGYNRTIMISSIGLILFLNHVYHFVDDMILVNLALIVGGYLTLNPRVSDMEAKRR